METGTARRWERMEPQRRVDTAATKTPIYVTVTLY